MALHVQNPAERALAARQTAEEELLLGPLPQALSAESGTERACYENIVGVGLAERVVGTCVTGEEAVAVYVVHKLPAELVDPAALVPADYEGVPTDVVECGEFLPLTERGRHRPAQSGVSLAHHASTAGTLGFIASQNGETFVVSNNHVLAQENEATLGDFILQPAPSDGGGAGDELAELAGWQPLEFGGGDNFVDAAFARTSSDLVSGEVYGVGALDPEPYPAERDVLVRKRGRTSQLTRGIIRDAHATVKLPYNRGIALLQDQILVRGLDRAFSEGGDSGSLVYEEHGRRPVGLLCAGSPRYSVVNRITLVLDALGLSLVV